MFAIHNSPTYWDAPHEFRPERWLVEGGDMMSGKFMPFLLGARNCIGQVQSTFVDPVE